MNIQQEANAAIQAMQRGSWHQAIQHAQAALQASPRHPELLHILAMALKGASLFEQAQQAFEFCLQLQPKHAVARGNYANMLYQLERFQEAEKHYRQTILDQPKHADAKRNLAMMLGLKMQRYDDALGLLGETTDPAEILLKADIKQAKGETADALLLVEQVLQQLGEEPLVILKKARMQRDLGQSAEALAYLQERAGMFEGNPDYAYLLGCLNYDLGEWQACEDQLQMALNINPLMLEAHQALNQLFWEQSRDKDFLNSYQLLRKINHYDPAARLNEVATLIQTEHLEQAQELLNEGLKRDGNLAEYRHALGAIVGRKGMLEQAESHLRFAADAAPDSPRLQIDLANIFIKLGDYSSALERLERVAAIVPNNQEVWAYKGLCWRLCGDEKFHWLYDERLIDYRPLAIPANYDNAEHFFASLADSLSKLHTSSRQPLDQSVTGGTQSMGNLFVQTDPVIQDYRSAMQQRVSDFLASLPREDMTHPFYRRLTSSFRFAGAWSVSLQGDGYHTNHVHPEGWLSGPCYVDVPQICSVDDPQQQGWVILGETSLQLGEREQVYKALCPQIGWSLLFPSYMWHGTRRFESSQRRMTAPIDVLPL